MDFKVCEVCKNKFIKKYNYSRKYWKIQRFCSKKCKCKWQIGKDFAKKSRSHIAWNKGKKDCWEGTKVGFQKGHIVLEEIRKKLSLAMKGRKLSEEHIRKISEGNKGKIPWIKGKHLSEESKIKLREALKEENSYNWKGENAGYSAKHMWVRKYFGTPNKCENPNCVYPRKDSTGNIMLKPKRFEWANRSGKYLRKRDDWIKLCKSCHVFYDMGKISLD